MLKLKGGERLYVSVNQGCTELEKQVGRREAAAELRRRADLMRRKIENIPAGFSSQPPPQGQQENAPAAVYCSPGPFLRRGRKAIYIELHPETAFGVAGNNARQGQQLTICRLLPHGAWRNRKTGGRRVAKLATLLAQSDSLLRQQRPRAKASASFNAMRGALTGAGLLTGGRPEKVSRFPTKILVVDRHAPCVNAAT